MSMTDALPVGFREMPNNVEAEQALLGAILYENERYADVSHIIRADDFYEPVHRRIFGWIKGKLDSGEAVDHITLRFAFNQDEALRELNGAKYLEGLTNAAVTILNVRDYALVIKDLAVRRQIIATAQEASNLAYDPKAPETASAMLAKLDNHLDAIRGSDAFDEERYEGLDIISVSERPRPVRQWIAEGYVPEGYMTLLAGDSGLGKSLLAQQLATHVALGRDWLGHASKRRKVLFLATEDDENELVIRQQDINADMGIDGTELAGYLDLLPRAGFDNFLVTCDGDIGEPTTAYRKLDRYIDATRPGLLIADNIFQLLAGDPSKGSHAAFFCNCIMAFHRKYNVTPMLLGHVPKNNPDAGYFGSAVWRATVRSHLVLKKHDTDKCTRVLVLPKANYAENDDDGIELRWKNGVLRAESEGLMSYGEKLEKQMREREVEQIFLRALDQLTTIEFSLSHRRNANNNYAPDVIAERGMNEDFTIDEIEKAMKRLESKDVIRRQQELPWKRPGSRHPAVGWARTEI